MANRRLQAVLIASTLLNCWLGMQAVHELGHILGATITGGRVQRVVLHPLTISRTDLAENPRPLAVAWAGPVGGVFLPLLAWAVVERFPGSGRPLLRFFAGFCLVANGGYLGAGWIQQLGDCRDLLQGGAPIWSMCLFALLTVPTGFWLWHGQGAHFGLGSSAGRVDGDLVLVSVIISVLLILLGLMNGS